MVIGIDEVGRGCLAGPVTVCAVAVAGKFKAPKDLPELRDSKKMTSAQREVWCERIKKEGRDFGVYYAVSSVSPKMIDKINISRAANLAAWRSYRKLLAILGEDMDAEVILDGGLFLKGRSFQKELGIAARTVVRADDTFCEVKMASIVAKVTRDAMMKREAKRTPGYGFEVHKGYGTAAHREAIRNKGRVKGLHRDSFRAK